MKTKLEKLAIEATPGSKTVGIATATGGGNDHTKDKDNDISRDYLDIINNSIEA